MSKIICDICGTTYPDTAEQCPICGCSRDAAVDLLGDELLMEQVEDEPKGRGGRFTTKKKKEIFDFDEVNSPAPQGSMDDDDDPYEEEEAYYPQEQKPNTGVVILLTVLIAVLLLAAGFLFVRYFLPNLGGSDPTVPVTEPVLTQPTEQNQPLTVPCEGMTMTSARQAVLNQEGGKFLIHVTTTPSNTTDQIVFTSSDESVATVTADGRVEAVAEGQAVITVTCGQWSMEVNVTVKFEEQTLPPTTEATEATDATDPAEGETTPEQTPEQTQAPAGGDGLKDVTLKLKQTDFRLGVYYEHQLKLDCALEQNEVEWSSEHPYIATVDENGVVKAIKSGTTSITAKYGDQEVSCIVRCF